MHAILQNLLVCLDKNKKAAEPFYSNDFMALSATEQSHINVDMWPHWLYSSI